MQVLVETYKGHILRAWGRVVAGSSVVVPCFEVYLCPGADSSRHASGPSRLLCLLELSPVAGVQAAATTACTAAQQWIDRHLLSAVP